MGYGRGYWNYYYTPESPKKVAGGIKARSKRGKIGESWWSRRWIEVLESFRMGARLSRAKSYARQGQVTKIDMKPGKVSALVQGTRSKPYKVMIKLPQLSSLEWKEVMKVMAANAMFTAKLLVGEMPREIETTFYEAGVSLLPKSRKELGTQCSCPDWANPCKHTAAVYFLMAEMFDDDPFLLFTLRGRTKKGIMKAMRKQRAETATSMIPGEHDSPDHIWISPEDRSRNFWGSRGEMPTISLELKSVDEYALLEKIGPSPFKVNGRNMNHYLKKIYGAVSKRALQVVFEDMDL